MTTVAAGTYNPDADGTAFSVDVLASFAATSIAAPFVISGGVDRTLISASLASSLGISISGPPELVTNIEFGTFSVPTVPLALDLFPEQGPNR